MNTTQAERDQALIEACIRLKTAMENTGNACVEALQPLMLAVFDNATQRPRYLGYMNSMQRRNVRRFFNRVRSVTN